MGCISRISKGAAIGAWGTEIFDNDTAADIRGDYADALASGLDRAAATQVILTAYADAVDESFDDGPVIWIALAAAQLEHGAVEPIVRERVFTALDQDLANWNTDDLPDEADLESRATALTELRARLQAIPHS